MERTPLSMGKHTPQRTMDCPSCYAKHGPMLETLCDYDWREAHTYATWEREDVAEIIHLEVGENDEAAWIALFKLGNGKFAGLNAWCDYTGWD